MTYHPPRREDFHVAIICAFTVEYEAMTFAFDEIWDVDANPRGNARGDGIIYKTGRIGSHNVVLLLLSGLGASIAASAVAQLQMTYTEIKMAVVSGTCSGVPNTRSHEEILLGDVVISSRIVRYDLDRQEPYRLIEQDDIVGRPNNEIRRLIEVLGTRRAATAFKRRTAEILKQIQDATIKTNHITNYNRPAAKDDTLFSPDYPHRHRGESSCDCSESHACVGATIISCEELQCDVKQQVTRRRLRFEGEKSLKDEGDVKNMLESGIHIGRIGSANTWIQSAKRWDDLAQKYGIIALEMEGAGVWDEIPCIIVKGVSEYADGHKNKKRQEWQDFAAAIAASATKALLERYGGVRFKAPRTWFIVPFSENPHFVGRSEVLHEIGQLLGHNYDQQPVPRRHSRVALYGLAGIGKTQTALAYVSWIRHTFPDVSVFWVSASNAERFRQSYLSIAQECSIPGYNDPKTNVLALVKAWLERNGQVQWLLVIDNADSMPLLLQQEHVGNSATETDTHDGLGRYIPECHHGSILITTRNKQTGSRLTWGKSLIKIGNISEIEAHLLLHKMFSNEISTDETQRLSARLEYLPLAIAQAVAFIQENSISVSKYLELLDENKASFVNQLSEPFAAVGRDPETSHTVTATFIVLFEQIQQQHPLASDILSVMSFYHYQDIPEDFIVHFSYQRRPDGLVTTAKADLTKALGTLKAFSFISETKHQTIHLHRLVQLVTQRWLLNNGKTDQFAEEALEVVQNAFPYGQHESRDVCRKYLPHAYAILEHFRTGSFHGMLAEASLLHCMAGYHIYQCQWKEAELLEIRATETKKEVIGEEHPETLRSLANLALTYREQDQLKNAEELELHVIEVRKRIFGEHHPETLSSLANLALTYQRQGRWKEAEVLELQVMEMRKMVLGEEHPETLSSVANLALTYQRQGRWKEAEVLELQVMEMRKRVLGYEHPETLTSIANLAWTYQAQDRWKEAEALLSDVVQMSSVMLGEEHPITLRSIGSLASTYRKQGRWEEAKHLEMRVTKAKVIPLTGYSTEVSDKRIPDGQPTLGVMVVAPPTDSGYASAPAGSHRGKVPNAFGAAPHSVIEGITEEQVHSGDVSEPGFPDIISEYSTSSTVPLQQVEQYISDMAQELVTMVPQSTRGDSIAMARLTQMLPDVLKAFALMIGHCASTPFHREIMYFVHKHRSDIVQNFQACFLKDEAKSLQGDGTGMTVTEKVDQWHELISRSRHEELIGRPDSEYGDKDEEAIERPASEYGNEYEDNTNQATQELPTLRDYLVNSSAYDWLQDALSREIILQPANPDIRNGIRKATFSLLPPGRVSRFRDAQSYNVVFEMDWDPKSFVKGQGYEEPFSDAIGMAITLTGSSQDAQALTVDQYLSQTWPSIGKHIMRIIQEVLYGKWKEGRYTILPDKTTVTAEYNESSFMVIAHGSATSITELAELLSWLGAALRLSPREHGIIHCTPHIRNLYSLDAKTQLLSTDELRFKISFKFDEEDSASDNGQCWHDMFRNPVIVRGYPIAKRAVTETGLEMPLGMMASMVRTKQIVPFGGTFFLKGFSSMLALAEQKGNLVLWHHLYDRDGRHISYFNHKSTKSNIPTLSQLETARHVVGWCSKINFYAGAIDGDVNYDVENSNLLRTDSTCVLDRFTISGGKFVSASMGIRIGVAQTPVHIARDTYFEKLKWIAKRYVVLWDEGENRGWLSNGPSVLLHLVLASLHNDLRGKLKSKMLFEPESLEKPSNRHTTNSAIEVLMNEKNKRKEIHVDRVDTWEETEETQNEGDAPPTTVTKTKTKTTYTRFQDRVERMYCLLEQTMEKQASIEEQDGLDLKMRVRKFLEGWDFRDFTIGEDRIYPRVKTLHTIANGWVDFTREINAITIFGKGFGEIIRPADTNSICVSWARQPSQKYYLAACVSDLIEAPQIKLYAREVKIGNRIVWKVPDDLFKPCKCASKRIGKVDHSHIVQVLAPQGGKSNRVPKSTGETQLEGKGAVIFGYNSRFRLHWSDKGDPAEEEIKKDTLEPPMHEEDFHDSAIGTISVSMTTGGSDAQMGVLQDMASAPALEIAASTPGFQGSDQKMEVTPSDRRGQDAASSSRNNEADDRIGELSIHSPEPSHAVVAGSQPGKEVTALETASEREISVQRKKLREKIDEGVRSFFGRHTNRLRKVLKSRK